MPTKATGDLLSAAEMGDHEALLKALKEGGVVDAQERLAKVDAEDRPRFDKTIQALTQATARADPSPVFAERAMLNVHSKERIRPLVELNDRINTLTKAERTINAARIVVVGDQSHGKSSLLEALSGVDLPRGEDIKTRVPLILGLRNTIGEEYALISIQGDSDHEPERISLADVANKVDEYTAKIAGADKVVKDTPIELKVYRRDQDDLTLVDLPGITRTSREGQGSSGKALEAMILNMCRRYCEPDESVILNVVSAMVDFSTSASLQLSQELDPNCRRTLLCVTKIDQHQEDGLAKKLGNAASQLKLRRDRVFAVRNRKQQENERQMPLAEARRAEAEFFATHDEMSRGSQQFGYGRGVAELSERLVSIQLERIQETLPATHTAIVEKMAQLRARLDAIGRPLGDELSCRLLAHKLVDQCIEKLAVESSGRQVKTTCTRVAESPVGGHEELSLRLDEIENWRKQNKPGGVVKSDEVELPGGVHLCLQLRPLGDEVKDVPKGEAAGMSAYVFCSALPEGARKIVCVIDMELLSADGTSVHKCESENMELTNNGRGWRAFIPGATASNLVGEVELHASVYVKSVDWADDAKGETNELLCARINDLDLEFTNHINAVQSDRCFFSSAFLAKLKAETEARRGAAGLPGAIAPDVPLGILGSLTKKLGPIVEAHVNAFRSVVAAKIELVIDETVHKQAHPRFHGMLLQRALMQLDECASLAQHECARLLDYEHACCWTANHYYMDIVQDLRREILADEASEPPTFAKRPYLLNFNFANLKKKGNQEQEMIDMTIKTFAYWKTLKKRLIDYVLMACRCNLSTELIDKKLKPALLTATEDAGSLCTLMAPDDALARERNDVATRLDSLNEAHRLLDISMPDLARRAPALTNTEASRRKLSVGPMANAASTAAAAVKEPLATPTTACTLNATAASAPAGMSPVPLSFGFGKPATNTFGGAAPAATNVFGTAAADVFGAAATDVAQKGFKFKNCGSR